MRGAHNKLIRSVRTCIFLLTSSSLLVVSDPRTADYIGVVTQGVPHKRPLFLHCDRNSSSLTSAVCKKLQDCSARYRRAFLDSPPLGRFPDKRHHLRYCVQNNFSCARHVTPRCLQKDSNISSYTDVLYLRNFPLARFPLQTEHLPTSRSNIPQLAPLNTILPASEKTISLSLRSPPQTFVQPTAPFFQLHVPNFAVISPDKSLSADVLGQC